METVRVSLREQVIGFVRYDPQTDSFDHDPAVPADVVADIVVTFYRDNVLFGRSGGGYAWSETVKAKRVRCPTCGRLN